MKNIHAYKVLVRPLHRLLLFPVLPVLAVLAQTVCLMIVKANRPAAAESLLLVGWVVAASFSMMMWAYSDYQAFPGIYRKNLKGMDMLRSSERGGEVFQSAVKCDAVLKAIWYPVVYVLLLLGAAVMGCDVWNGLVLVTMLVIILLAYTGTQLICYLMRHYADMQIAIIISYITISFFGLFMMIAGDNNTFSAVIHWLLRGVFIAAAVMLAIMHSRKVKYVLKNYWYRDMED